MHALAGSVPAVGIAIRRILFATDFSPAAQAGLPYVAELARRFGAEVFLAHIIPPESYELAPAEPMQAADPAEWYARQRIADIVSSPLMAGIAHQVVVEHGHVSDRLLELARERAIDLVVTGTQARRGWRRLWMGSVAEEVYRSARCPVLILGQFAAHRPEPRLRRVLYSTDLLRGDTALRYAAAISSAAGAQLLALHVMPESQTPPPDLRVEDALHRLRHHLAPVLSQVRPELLVEAGDPEKVIPSLAVVRGVDLIVFEVRRAERFASHLGETLGHQLVTHAPCPVLTVRTEWRAST